MTQMTLNNELAVSKNQQNPNIVSFPICLVNIMLMIWHILGLMQFRVILTHFNVLFPFVNSEAKAAQNQNSFSTLDFCLSCRSRLGMITISVVPADETVCVCMHGCMETG